VVGLSLAVFAPRVAKADEPNPMLTAQPMVSVSEELIFSTKGFPVAEDRAPRYTRIMYLSAYNSIPGQTDSTPCIPADPKYNLCEWAEKGVVDTIATNILPKGTKVRFPDLFGGKVFTVRDRMNPRYNGKARADLYIALLNDEGKMDLKASKKTAINFGVKRVEMEVL
jgi:hypothetical protein